MWRLKLALRWWRTQYRVEGWQVCREVMDDLPNQTFVKPRDDMYSDIHVSPNDQFFKVFMNFDLTIPESRRLAMEFKRLFQFHNKHNKDIKDIWLNITPEQVKTYKQRFFKNSKFFQYTLVLKGVDYDKTQDDFIRMNPKELFLIIRILSLKIEKYHHFKLSYGRVCDYLRFLVRDYASIDVEIHHILVISSIPSYRRRHSRLKGRNNQLPRSLYYLLSWKKLQQDFSSCICLPSMHKFTAKRNSKGC